MLSPNAHTRSVIAPIFHIILTYTHPLQLQNLFKTLQSQTIHPLQAFTYNASSYDLSPHIINNIFSHFPNINLTGISITAPSKSSPDLTNLNKNIQHIKITSSNPYGLNLCELQQYPQLTSLFIHTDGDAYNLTNCTKLKKLNLTTHECLTEEVFKQLSTCFNIRDLKIRYLEGYAWNSHSVNLITFPNLRRVDLAITSNWEFEIILRCRTLCRVTLIDTSIWDGRSIAINNIDKLAQKSCGNIRYLDISRTFLLNPDLHKLTKLKTLVINSKQAQHVSIHPNTKIVLRKSCTYHETHATTVEVAKTMTKYM